MPVQDKPDTRVSFGTLELILSAHPNFNGSMWNRLYDLNRRSNRSAVEYVIRHIGNYPVSEAVADAVALLRRRVERE